jgi:hypothetical protein
MSPELTTQDLADTLEYWKSRAIRAEDLLQGSVDRELGNRMGVGETVGERDRDGNLVSRNDSRYFTTTGAAIEAAKVQAAAEEG